ncbi:hypothetical protein NEOLEDRAFT_1128147 [Neolentinus lepideus HHB14362 ss-1]|uniref:Uncharacterized protein n=1 Tax=Neolentinus lepideus HHB14362 ss-1 TaxID=1314782 RepID=A0A165VAH8_9AGAM|nr:hypothetical protein NEOLEDRAFT_1128147 [Neolentinus lepideus HHB14362 ss-1]
MHSISFAVRLDRQALISMRANDKGMPYSSKLQNPNSLDDGTSCPEVTVTTSWRDAGGGLNLRVLKKFSTQTSCARCSIRLDVGLVASILLGTYSMGVANARPLTAASLTTAREAFEMHVSTKDRRITSALPDRFDCEKPRTHATAVGGDRPSMQQ